MAVAISGPTSAAEQSARVLGQSGSGERGQSGSGERGQSGSGERGQSGSGERGQSGSGERAISVADVFGQSGSGSRGALGVVEQVTASAKASVVVILGQEFAVDGSTGADINVGDYVLATVDAESSAATLQKLSAAYVAGISPVGLMGVVSDVDAGRATLRIGGAAVDYSSQLTLNPSLQPASGGLYQTVGIQPSAGGVILAGLQYDGAVVALSLRP